MCFLLVSLVFVLALSADEITMAFAPVPPYVMKDANGNFSGLEFEIIKEALAAKGQTIKPVDYPLARVVETIKAGNVQAGARILPSHDTGRHLSEVYIIFNNVALGLQRKNLKIATIADLKGKRIVAFQRATIVLGPDFAAAAQGNAEYSEVAEQSVQIRMLFNDRVDVAVGEARILQYFIRDPQTAVDASIPTVEYRVFPETPYRVAFVNQKHMQDFNAGLAAIKANGTYDALIRKYSARTRVAPGSLG